MKPDEESKTIADFSLAIAKKITDELRNTTFTFAGNHYCLISEKFATTLQDEIINTISDLIRDLLSPTQKAIFLAHADKLLEPLSGHCEKNEMIVDNIEATGITKVYADALKLRPSIYLTNLFKFNTDKTILNTTATLSPSRSHKDNKIILNSMTRHDSISEDELTGDGMVRQKDILAYFFKHIVDLASREQLLILEQECKQGRERGIVLLRHIRPSLFSVFTQFVPFVSEPSKPEETVSYAAYRDYLVSKTDKIHTNRAHVDSLINPYFPDRPYR